MTIQISKSIRKRFQYTFIVAVLFAGVQVSMAQDIPDQNSLIVQKFASQQKSDGALMSIRYANVTLEEALELLADKINVGLSYNPEIMPDKRVKFNMVDVFPHEVLYRLLEGTNLEPVVIPSKDVIIIREKEKVEVNAFDETITGRVADAETGESLPGVNILVKGTEIGTSTDVNGMYELTVPTLNDTLIVSYIGYQREQVAIQRRTEINIQLIVQQIMGDELIVIGYGTQQSKDLTGSVSVIDAEQMKQMSSEGIGEALDGAVPGLTVQSTGAPGEPASLKIRGVGSFGNNEPLYVIDGVPVESIEDFNMQDVESLQVLKGPSSSAIYGARAANGVVIITTNTGQSGDVQVDYSGTVGYQDIYQRWDLTNAEEYREIVTQMVTNVGEPLPASVDPNSPQFVNNIDTNWQDEVFQAGLHNDHHLNISGGDQQNTYSLSLGYINQENTLTGRAPSYKRYSARIKSDHDISDKIRLGQSMFYSRSDRINQASQHVWSLTSNTFKMMPLSPVFNESNEGGYAGPPAGMETQQTPNPVALNNLLENENDINRFLGNVWGEFDIMDNLTYRLNFSYDNRNYGSTYFEPLYDIGVFFINTISNLTESTTKSTKMLIENTLNYQLDVGDHNFDVLLGYTEEQNDFDFNSGYAEGYSKPYFQVLDAGTTNFNISGNVSEYNLRSYLGRLNYNFDDRYLLTASVRRDGSSRFAEQNRYGVFPSASVGWRISEESFFNIPFINDLKLRAEYGKLGNQEIGNYQFLASINTSGANYNFANSLAPGAIQTSIVDPNIKWEENITSNIGVDISMLNNRLEITAEYYYSETQDLLLGVPIPPSVGSTSDPTVNAASLKNSGIELLVDFSNVVNDWSYSIDANIATVNNEVLSLGGGEPIFGTGVNIAYSRTAVGSEVGEFYGYVMDGIFQNQQEVDAHAFQAPTTSPGDIRFKDLNGDGQITALDRQYLGSVFPDFTFGFGGDVNYKNWNLSMRFIGSYGNKIYNDVRSQLESMTLYFNFSRTTLDYWTPQNTDTDMPRPAYNDPNDNNRMSERFIEDGSFLRLRNIRLGYTVEQDFLTRIGIRNLRINASIQNVFTITGYSGIDPSLGTTGDNNSNDGLFNRGIDSGSFPHPRIYTVGVQLGL